VSSSSRRLLAWGLWFWLLTFTFFGLDHAIGDGDECVHASALRDMMRAGDYLHLRYHGVLTLERPLLPYWLAAPFAWLIPNEPGFRMSSAIASFASLLVVFGGARRLWRRTDAALFGVLLLAGSPSFHAYSRALMSDPPMLLSICLAIVGAVRMLTDPRALSLVAAGTGLAIACKSLIVAVPIVALAPWVVFVFVRRADGAIRLRACAWFAATALPYYALGFALHGARFGREHFLQSLIGRAVDSGGIGMPGGKLAFVRWIPEAEGPLTAAWLAIGIFGGIAWGVYRRRTDLLLLGCYALMVIACMSLLATRLPHYVLPAYPAAALAAAGLYAALIDRPAFGEHTLFVLIGPALGLLILLVSRAYPGGNQYLLQGNAGRDLGRIARTSTEPGQTLYAYEWYGPSLKFYAERPLVLLTANEQRYRVVKPFVEAIQLVPPPPLPVGGAIVIAGEARALSQTPWLKVDEVLGFSAPRFLARAHVVGFMTEGGTRRPRPAGAAVGATLPRVSTATCTSCRESGADVQIVDQ
jgi:4-amino-4-deoxy-L-arabinose transferase-like glycosyltransferase